MQNTKTPSTSRNLNGAYQCMAISFMALALYGLLAPEAYAVGGVLCGMIAGTMGGGLARAIATIGVLMVGVGATLGKVSWTLAITVAVGIAAIFATASIVGSLNSMGQMGCFGT